MKNSKPLDIQKHAGCHWFRMTKKERLGLLLFIPSLLGIALVIFKPLVDSIIMSLYDIDLLFGGSDAPFVGLENYKWVFTSDWFLPTLGRTVLVSGVVMSIQVILALIVALITDFDFPGKGLVRSMLISPWIIPIVVAGLMWNWMYDPTIGPINDFLMGIGAIKAPMNWLGQTNTALGAVMVALVWKGLPFVYLTILGAMQQVPEDQKEAARVDGANGFQEFWYITLPGIREVVTTMIILRTIFLFNHFSFIHVLTGGGPLGSTEVLAITAVKMGVNSFRYGRASAITTTMFGILLVLFAVYYSLDQKRRSQAA
ncbi:MAG: sugar ABC transporter permease [Firmicutes bacterium]|nr:sugar ABC transporter permease [Bacillota bacterium]